MAGLRKKRRSMKQTLLRRAILTEFNDVNRSALYDVPQARSSPQAKGITVLTSLNKSPHLGHIIQRNPINNLDSGLEPAGAQRISRIRIDKKSSPIKHIAKDNRSGDSLKARGSRGSRASSLNYPSSWNLHIPRIEEAEEGVKDELSLSEVRNCDLLKRTPYDHRLNDPVPQRRPKIDSSVQCTISHRTRQPSILRRTKATVRNVAQTQTAPLRVSMGPKQRLQRIRSKPLRTVEAHRSKRKETHSTGIVRIDEELQPFDGTYVNLPLRVSSGNAQSRSESVISSTAFNKRTGTKTAGGQNYGGYTPSECSCVSVRDVQQQSPDRLNRIEQISQPPPVTNRQFENYPDSKVVCECETESELESDFEFKGEDPNIEKSSSEQRVWIMSKDVIIEENVVETDSYEQQVQNIPREQGPNKPAHKERQEPPNSSCARQCLVCNNATTQTVARRRPVDAECNCNITYGTRERAPVTGLEGGGAGVKPAVAKSPNPQRCQISNSIPASKGRQENAAKNLRAKETRWAARPTSQQKTQNSVYTGQQNQVGYPCNCHCCLKPCQYHPGETNPYVQIFCEYPCPSCQIGSSQSSASAKNYAASSKSKPIGSTARQRSNSRSKEQTKSGPNAGQGNCVPICKGKCNRAARHTSTTDLPRKRHAARDARGQSNKSSFPDGTCKCHDNSTQTGWDRKYNRCQTENAQVQCDCKCPNCGADINTFENDGNQPSQKEEGATNMWLKPEIALKQVASNASKDRNGYVEAENNETQCRPGQSNIDEDLFNECECCAAILNKKHQKEMEKEEEQQRQQEQKQRQYQQQEQQPVPHCNKETCTRKCGRCKIIPAKAKEGDATVNLVVDDTCNVNQIIEILQETVAQLEEQKQKQSRSATNPIVAQGSVDNSYDRMYENGPWTARNPNYVEEDMPMAYVPTVPYGSFQNHCNDQSANYMAYNGYPEYNQYPPPINKRQLSQKKGQLVSPPTGARKSAVVRILTQTDYDYPPTTRGFVVPANRNGHPEMPTFKNEANDPCTCCPVKNQLRKMDSNGNEVRPCSGSSYPFEGDSKVSLCADEKRNILQKMKATKSFMEIYEMAMALKKENRACRKNDIVDGNMENHFLELPGTKRYVGNKLESINRKYPMQIYPTTLYKDHERQNQNIVEPKVESPSQDVYVCGHSFKRLRQTEGRDHTKKHVMPELNSSDSECCDGRDLFLKQRKKSGFEQLSQFQKQQIQDKHGSYRKRRAKNYPIERKLCDETEDKYSNDIQKTASEISAPCCRRKPKKNVEPLENQEQIYVKLKELICKRMGVSSSKLIGFLPYLESDHFRKTNRKPKVSHSRSNQSGEVRDKDKAGEDTNYSKPTQNRPRSRIHKIENQEVSLAKFSNDAKAKYPTSKIILDVGKHLRRERKEIKVSDHSEIRQSRSIERESDNFEPSISKSKRKDRIKEVTHPEKIKRQISKTFSVLSGINEIKKEAKDTVECPQTQFIEEAQREPKLKGTSSGLLIACHKNPKVNKLKPPIPPQKPEKSSKSKSSDFFSHRRRKSRHGVSQTQSKFDDIKVLYDSSYKFLKYSYGDGDTNTDCECAGENRTLHARPSEGPNNFFCMLGTRNELTGCHRYSR